MNNRIREARKQSAYKTQKAISEKLEVRREYYARLEAGGQEPSDRLLKDIARITNTNYEWLKTGKGEMIDTNLDATALVVSELLEETNPLYELVLKIVSEYMQLPQTDRKVIDDLINRIKEE